MSSSVQEFPSFSAKKKPVFAVVSISPLVMRTALKVLPVMRSVEKVEGECKNNLLILLRQHQLCGAAEQQKWQKCVSGNFFPKTVMNHHLDSDRSACLNVL